MTDYSPPDIEDPGLPRTSLTELKVLLNSITIISARKWDIILELDVIEQIVLMEKMILHQASPLASSLYFFSSL